ncbi:MULTISPECIES: hypothetical protein [Nocardia]|uniref:Uncharacterized protein n=1 Tax=Nocardia bhagyanarayanae TaxID=1215925 RepID=A0A543FEP3_9NOCA|nr:MULTISPECIES: hypothetical protein [Nocardia]MCP2288306.1 hypothetical protein [Nocardia amikacinitolerans]TQM32329.1 hypothetical protein FB390_4008 [Nocardia bhagyanarayanae]
MVSRDTIAQLRQDITTAEDCNDRQAAERLRAELAEALRAKEQGEDDAE